MNDYWLIIITFTYIVGVDDAAREGTGVNSGELSEI